MASEVNERRLAAIMAADVVGYSRMVGADETGTLARLRALRTDQPPHLLRRRDPERPNARLRPTLIIGEGEHRNVRRPR